MTLKAGLQLGVQVLSALESSSVIDSNGNLTKPTIGGALNLIAQLNTMITAAGVTEPGEINTVMNILTTVSKLV